MLKGSVTDGTTLSVPVNKKVLGPLRTVYVARMERSEIRGESLNHDAEFLDYAALHPGYVPWLLRVWPDSSTIQTHACNQEICRELTPDRDKTHAREIFPIQGSLEPVRHKRVEWKINCLQCRAGIEMRPVRLPRT